MSLAGRLAEDLKAAMKQHDAARVSTLRMILADLKNEGIRVGKRDGLEEEDEVRVLRRALKQRKDSAEQYERGGRAELARAELAEAALIESYLPAGLDEAAIRGVLEEVVREIGAVAPADIGKVMKAAMGRLKGQADGATVKRIAAEMLA